MPASATPPPLTPKHRLPPASHPATPPLPFQVIAQCQHCQAWHKLADAAGLVYEIRYADLEDE